MHVRSPENLEKTRKKIQRQMLGQLNRAVDARRKLSDVRNRQVREILEKWRIIVSRIRDRADQLAYHAACKNHIPTCRGECCKWHFPKALYDVHFFISINGLTDEETQALVRLLSDETDGRYQCPLLMEDGCFLSFENRPVLCSAAYPCFAKKEYYAYLNGQKEALEELYDALERIIIRACGSNDR